MLRVLAVCALLCPVWAADPQAVLEDLRAADATRATTAREAGAWQAERARLESAIAALEAEAKRLEDAAKADLAAVSALAGEARAAQVAAEAQRSPLAVLAEADTRTRTRLVALAARLPAQAIAQPNEAGLLASLRALVAAEQALASCAVHVSEADVGGQRRAVRVLRVGACAWWLALDGGSGGACSVAEGRLVCQAAGPAEVRSIAEAIAQAERRVGAGLHLLPLPPGMQR
jgi:uncharacterized protein YfaS (alpha-2-macroglobulin family)